MPHPASVNGEDIEMIDFKTFYGLSENPFDAASDARFFFPSESHREALASLQYGITYRKGFMLILGAAGSGKTMLIERLISVCARTTRIIFFPHSQVPFPKMLAVILEQMNLTAAAQTKGAMMHSLYYGLMECQKRDETVVLVMDQAEKIPLEVLEEVRLLANLETGASKLLQIVLVGRPELGRKLQSRRVRQIVQRIAIRGGISLLAPQESRQYIDHRLGVAGGTSGIFAEDALAMICKSAKGCPRTLNTLGHNALMLGGCLSEKPITASTVKKIRGGKNPLTETEAKGLASGFSARLSGKIVLTFFALAGLLMLIAFGKASLSALLNALKPHPRALVSADSEKAAAPESRAFSIPDHTQHPPAPFIAADAPPAAGKPASENIAPNAAPAKPHPGIRIRTVVDVQKGSSLSVFAFRNYKMTNETLVDHIIKANPEIANPGLLEPGQKIRIPEITEALLIIRSPDNLYHVHLRTFEDLKGAQHYRRIAASWGQPTETSPWPISEKETWHRVLAGPFANYSEAAKALESMKKKGFTVIPFNP